MADVVDHAQAVVVDELSHRSAVHVARCLHDRPITDQRVQDHVEEELTDVLRAEGAGDEH